MKKEDFREALTNYIKDAGQEIIDRAEEIADSDLISDLHIDIDFNQETNASVPVISWRTEVICRTAYERLKKKNEKPDEIKVEQLIDTSLVKPCYKCEHYLDGDPICLVCDSNHSNYVENKNIRN